MRECSGVWMGCGCAYLMCEAIYGAKEIIHYRIFTKKKKKKKQTKTNKNEQKKNNYKLDLT
jgi:hypothetical protein